MMSRVVLLMESSVIKIEMGVICIEMNPNFLIEVYRDHSISFTGKNRKKTPPARGSYIKV